MKQRDFVDAGSLRKLKNLSSLASAQLQRLAASMSVKKVKRREKIFDEGEVANTVYLLISGIVKISWTNQERRHVLVRLIPPGEFFGMGSLFSQMRHPFRANAVNDCTVGVIKPEVLVDILTGLPYEVYLRYNELTMGRLWGMLVHCVRGIGISLRKRLALELLELGTHFGVEDSRGTILSVRPTHEDLANSVGASRQKVTECLGEFERHRVVIRDGRRLIIVPRRLREILEKG